MKNNNRIEHGFFCWRRGMDGWGLLYYRLHRPYSILRFISISLTNALLCSVVISQLATYRDLGGPIKRVAPLLEIREIDSSGKKKEKFP
jgi:hypothetical protein